MNLRDCNDGWLVEKNFNIGEGGFLTIIRFKSLVCRRLPKLLAVQMEDAEIFYLLVEPASLEPAVKDVSPCLRDAQQWPNFCLPVGFESLTVIPTRNGRFLFSKEPFRKPGYQMLIDDPEKNGEKYRLFKSIDELKCWLGGTLLLMGVPLVNMAQIMDKILDLLCS